MMLTRLNHVAIAVPALEAAAATYRDMFGAHVCDPEALPEHGVRVAFVTLDNTRIELMEPFGDNSPIASYLSRHPAGGIHHLCYEVADIEEAAARLVGKGARIIGDGRPKIGAHGKPVLFLHPADFNGTLIELEQV